MSRAVALDYSSSPNAWQGSLFNLTDTEHLWDCTPHTISVDLTGAIYSWTKPAITEAVTTWLKAVGPGWTLTDHDGDITVHLLDNLSAGEGGYAAGVVGSHVDVVLPAWGGTGYQATLSATLHELGHATGLDHHPGGIMGDASDNTGYSVGELVGLRWLNVGRCHGSTR
jgi:hypothetical protein